MKIGVVGRGHCASAVVDALRERAIHPLRVTPEQLAEPEGQALAIAESPTHWIVLDARDLEPVAGPDGAASTRVAFADPPAAAGMPLVDALVHAVSHVSIPIRRPDGGAGEVVVGVRSGETGPALARRAARQIVDVVIGSAQLVPSDAAWPGPAPEPPAPSADWSRPAAELCRRVRAMRAPFPGVPTQLDDLQLEILSLEEAAWTGTPRAIAGRLVVDGTGVRVRCGHGAVRVLAASIAGTQLDRHGLGRLVASQGVARFGLPDHAGLPFGVPTLTPTEERAVVRTLRSRWIGTGPGVAALEDAFREATGARNAVAVSSCTAALHLSLLAAGVGPGDEVLTTPLTFVATANAILYTGATPAFADVEPDTLNLSPAAVRAAIGPRTRAIVPVHFGGRTCDMDALRAIARDAGIAIVEDAAHAAGAAYADGDAVGAGPDETCFSFYPNKNLTSCEGGMITTGSAERARRYRRLRMHGLSADAWKRFGADETVRARATELGFKYNLTDLQAALGRVQLERLEAFTRIRDEQAARYAAAFADCVRFRPLPPQLPGRARHAWHLYSVRVDGIARDRAQQELRRRGIGAAIHYEPVHLQPYFRERLGIAPGSLPVAEAAGATTLTLPIGPSLQESDVKRIVDAVRLVDRLPIADVEHEPERAGSREGRPVSTDPCAPRPTTPLAG